MPGLVEVFLRMKVKRSLPVEVSTSAEGMPATPPAARVEALGASTVSACPGSVPSMLLAYLTMFGMLSPAGEVKSSVPKKSRDCS